MKVLFSIYKLKGLEKNFEDKKGRESQAERELVFLNLSESTREKSRLGWYFYRNGF